MGNHRYFSVKVLNINITGLYFNEIKLSQLNILCTRCILMAWFVCPWWTDCLLRFEQEYDTLYNLLEISNSDYCICDLSLIYQRHIRNTTPVVEEILVWLKYGFNPLHTSFYTLLDVCVAFLQWTIISLKSLTVSWRYRPLVQAYSCSRYMIWNNIANIPFQ